MCRMEDDMSIRTLDVDCKDLRVQICVLLALYHLFRSVLGVSIENVSCDSTFF